MGHVMNRKAAPPTPAVERSMKTRDELIAAARAVAKALGRATISQVEFEAAQGIGRKRIYRHFGSWRAFCAQAGLEPKIARRAFSDDRIFRALHDAFLALGGIGSFAEIRNALTISIDTVCRRPGGWRQALADFAVWAKSNAPGFPYAAELEARIASVRRRHGGVVGPRWRPVGGRLCGDPLHDGAMLHEPTSEGGVILMFGALARELGFRVESVAPGFPDCIAKRRIAPRQWESVRIELEYRSRNFRSHRHDPTGCDLIVCWEHDWKDCPIEVLELRAAMAVR